MLFSSLLLTGALASGFAVPVQSTMPSACFIVGEVSHAPGQVSADLSSNCAIEIEQKDQFIIMRSRRGEHRTFVARIPDQHGLLAFVYRWGQSEAYFDDERVTVLVGPLATMTR
jgi:hypothetical protein